MSPLFHMYLLSRVVCSSFEYVCIASIFVSTSIKYCCFHLYIEVITESFCDSMLMKSRTDLLWIMLTADESTIMTGGGGLFLFHIASYEKGRSCSYIHHV